jgi:hypothetical protein
MYTVLLHKQPPALFTPAVARILAQQLAHGEDDGWTFSVELDPGTPPTTETLAKIAVRDEENTFVGYWTHE